MLVRLYFLRNVQRWILISFSRDVIDTSKTIAKYTNFFPNRDFPFFIKFIKSTKFERKNTRTYFMRKAYQVTDPVAILRPFKASSEKTDSHSPLTCFQREPTFDTAIWIIMKYREMILRQLIYRWHKSKLLKRVKKYMIQVISIDELHVIHLLTFIFDVCHIRVHRDNLFMIMLLVVKL